MYFSDSYELRQLEKLMRSIPNFRPRGHGVVILRRYEYTEKDCDCRACPHHTVYLCHDSDVDGQKAAVRIANKLTEQGINTEILVPIRKDWNEDLLYPPDETEEEICIQTM